MSENTLLTTSLNIRIIPTFWTLNDCNEAGIKLNPSAEALFLDSMITARAFENTCGKQMELYLLRNRKLIEKAVIFANAGGPPGKGFAGLSQITVPFVGALAKLGGAAEGMTVADVDMQILEDAEANYQVRSDIMRDDWHYDYRHSTTRE